jgi:drug/metabolite transporter (DMT)-like permease
MAISSVSRGFTAELVVVSALTAAIFPLIKVGLHDFEPVVMASARSLAAGVPLFALTCWGVGGLRGGYRAVRGCGLHGVAMGLLNYTVPMLLISWAEKHIDSGVAAIVTATTPVFVAVLAIRFMPSERVAGLRLVGLIVSLAGVGVLTGVRPQGGWPAVAATVVTVVAAVLYAIGSIYGQWGTASAAMRPDALATMSALSGGLILLPLAVVQWPDHMPRTTSILAIAGLTVIGPIIAQPLFFRMLRVYGASLTNLMTYLIPPIALLYGAAFLDESVRLPALLGLVLILAGVVLGSGSVGPKRETAPAAEAPL